LAYKIKIPQLSLKHFQTDQSFPYRKEKSVTHFEDASLACDLTSLSNICEHLGYLNDKLQRK
jgi:hypothetical protein